MARVKQTAVSSSGKRRKHLHKSIKSKAGGEDGGDGVRPKVVNIKGKRRYRSGTVAVREIRKYTKSTALLFPKAPFNRLVREITQDIKSDIRYTSEGMLAMHEAAEQFITEKFIKADLARRHARRETLHIADLQFTPYMTHIASEIVGNKIKG